MLCCTFMTINVFWFWFWFWYALSNHKYDTAKQCNSIAGWIYSLKSLCTHTVNNSRLHRSFISLSQYCNFSTKQVLSSWLDKKNTLRSQLITFRQSMAPCIRFSRSQPKRKQRNLILCVERFWINLKRQFTKKFPKPANTLCILFNLEKLDFKVRMYYWKISLI